MIDPYPRYAELLQKRDDAARAFAEAGLPAISRSGTSSRGSIRSTWTATRACAG